MSQKSAKVSCAAGLRHACTQLRTSAQFRMVSGDYFEVLKIPVRLGRAFGAADKSAAQNVIIVNETFARTLLQTADPLGQRLTMGRGFGETPRQIIGVVADVKQFGLDSHAPPAAFVPVSQVSNKLLLVSRRFIASYFIVRTNVDPLSLSATVKLEMAAFDPSLPLPSMRSHRHYGARMQSPSFTMLEQNHEECFSVFSETRRPSPGASMID